MNWHLDERSITAYTALELDDARAASVEAHVIACAECRSRFAGHVDRTRIDAVWDDVVDATQRPRRRFLERVLTSLGVGPHIARLISATPALSASWFAAVTVTLVWSLAAAHAGARGVLAFLVVAPLIPLAGVALAYGPGIDPAYEVGLAAPMSSFRILLLRTATVLAASIGLIGAASTGLPDIGWKAAAWLLPALGVSMATLALSTWIDARWAGACVAFAWVTFASTSAVTYRKLPVLDRVAAFDPAGQAACAIAVVVCAAIVAARGRRPDLRSHI